MYQQDQFNQYNQNFQDNFQDDYSGNQLIYYEYPEQSLVPNDIKRPNRMIPNVQQIRQINYMNPQMASLQPMNYNYSQNSVLMSNDNSVIMNRGMPNGGYYVPPQFNLPQNSLNNNLNMAHNVLPQHFINRYSPVNSNQHIFSEQKIQAFYQQFRLNVNFLKSQNSMVIERLKGQNKKLIDQYRIIKDMILSGTFKISPNSQAKSVLKNLLQNGVNKLNQNQNQTTNQFSNVSRSDEVQQTQQGMSPAFILQKKIKSLSQKKNLEQKIKLEVPQKLQESAILSPSEKNLTKNLGTVAPKHQIQKNAQQSTKKRQKQKRPQKQNQTQNQTHQDSPEYPQSFSGDVSLLIDDQVQQQEKKKISLNNKQQLTFGIMKKSKTNPDVAFVPKGQTKNNDCIQKQTLLIDQFFNDYLCQRMEYAPKKSFKNHFILKKQLIELYSQWRTTSLKGNQKNFHLTNEATVQRKLTQQFKKRFASCVTERNYFLGVKFKNTDLSKSLINRK